MNKLTTIIGERLGCDMDIDGDIDILDIACRRLGIDHVRIIDQAGALADMSDDPTVRDMSIDGLIFAAYRLLISGARVRIEE